MTDEELQATIRGEPLPHIYGSHPYEDQVRRRKERMDEEYDPEVRPTGVGRH